MGKNSFVSRWIPVFIWMGVIFLVSSVSNPYSVVPDSLRVPHEILGRYLHVLEFAVLALLVTRAFFLQGNLISRGRVMSAAFILSQSYSLLDEVHQSFVPGRTFQVLDLSLDLAGTLLGLVAGYCIYFLKTKQDCV